MPVYLLGCYDDLIPLAWENPFACAGTIWLMQVLVRTLRLTIFRGIHVVLDIFSFFKPRCHYIRIVWSVNTYTIQSTVVALCVIFGKSMVKIKRKSENFLFPCMCVLLFLCEGPSEYVTDSASNLLGWANRPGGLSNCPSKESKK
jgi:hypothetical protein